jgi:site-specific DNA-cytosine methylase
MVVSPHLINNEFGGRPQVRNRVFIAATRIPKDIPNFKTNRLDGVAITSHGYVQEVANKIKNYTCFN